MAKEKQEKIETAVSDTGQEPAFLAQYRIAYPNNRNFYVTGDKMVFLSHEYKKAVSHQMACRKGELKTY